MSCEGVGDVYDAANSSPVTCVDVEKVPVGSTVRENPVKPVEEMGLTPMFPAVYWHHRQKSEILKILYNEYFTFVCYNFRQLRFLLLKIDFVVYRILRSTIKSL